MFIWTFWSQRLRKSPPAVMSSSRETPCIVHGNTLINIHFLRTEYWKYSQLWWLSVISYGMAFTTQSFAGLSPWIAEFSDRSDHVGFFYVQSTSKENKYLGLRLTSRAQTEVWRTTVTGRNNWTVTYVNTNGSKTDIITCEISIAGNIKFTLFWKLTPWKMNLFLDLENPLL